MRNDGWREIDYEFGLDKETGSQLSALLNEICHVFHCHADGQWRSCYKPGFVERLGTFLARDPSLAGKLLGLGDRVISNVTYAALEQRRP